MKKHIQEIIGNIIAIIVYIMIGAFVIGLILGVISKLTKTAILLTIAQYCFKVFLILVFSFTPLVLVILIIHIVALVKIMGYKKVVFKVLKIFLPAYAILVVISLIKNRKPEFIKQALYSLLVTINLLNIDAYKTIKIEKEKEV